MTKNVMPAVIKNAVEAPNVAQIIPVMLLANNVKTL